MATEYTADVETLLEWSRNNPVESKPLTATEKARNFGEWYGWENGGITPSRTLIGILHPEYSEEEITAYIEGAARRGR